MFFGEPSNIRFVMFLDSSRNIIIFNKKLPILSFRTKKLLKIEVEGESESPDTISASIRNCCLGQTSHVGAAPSPSSGQTSSEQSDHERRTGEAGQPGAEHVQICEEDDWRAGGRAAVTKEQRRCNHEGRGAMSHELEPERMGTGDRRRNRSAGERGAGRLKEIRTVWELMFLGSCSA
jgi:hypothetical protein